MKEIVTPSKWQSDRIGHIFKFKELAEYCDIAPMPEYSSIIKIGDTVGVPSLYDGLQIVKVVDIKLSPSYPLLYRDDLDTLTWISPKTGEIVNEVNNLKSKNIYPIEYCIVIDKYIEVNKDGDTSNTFMENSCILMNNYIERTDIENMPENCFVKTFIPYYGNMQIRYISKTNTDKPVCWYQVDNEDYHKKLKDFRFL